MKRKLLTVLAVASAVTLTAAVTVVLVGRKKAGYIRPMNLTYSFSYD